jgi:hypothetical protein
MLAMTTDEALTSRRIYGGAFWKGRCGSSIFRRIEVIMQTQTLWQLVGGERRSVGEEIEVKIL